MRADFRLGSLEDISVMDDNLVATVANSLGFGAYVPVILAVIGLVSAISTVYPQTWPGALVVHKMALLIGAARPASPASPVPTVAVIVPSVIKTADAMAVIKKAVISGQSVTVVDPLPSASSSPSGTSSGTNSVS